MAAIVDMGISRTDQLSLLRLPAEKLVLLPSPRYPSMPRFAVSRPHCNIDETEIRSAIFKVSWKPEMDDDVNFLFAAALRCNIFPRTSSVVEELTVVLLVCSSCFALLCNGKVEGMVCAACAGSVEKAVKRLPGIEDATVALLRNKAQVFYRPAFVEVT
jgi:hypothetical protein